jgi:hypothetical protein
MQTTGAPGLMSVDSARLQHTVEGVELALGPWHSRVVRAIAGQRSIGRSSHTTKVVGNGVRTPGAFERPLPITMLCFRNFVNAPTPLFSSK